MSKLKRLAAHLAASGVMAVTAHLAVAADPQWSFVYTGFNTTVTDALGTEPTQYDPTFKLWGTFSGKDLDADGILEKDELSALFVWYDAYIPCDTTLNTCTINAFSYSQGGGLRLDLFHYAASAVDSTYTVNIVKSGAFARSAYFNIANSAYYVQLDWTPQTTLVVTAPVPEPATYLMLGVGGLLLAARGWRRAKPA